MMHTDNVSPLTINSDLQSGLSSRNFSGIETSSVFPSDRKEERISGSSPTETTHTATKSVTEPMFIKKRGGY